MFECPDYDGYDPGIHAWAWDAKFLNLKFDC